jgi:5-methylcytosine-specific restriction enzyme B
MNEEVNDSQNNENAISQAFVRIFSIYPSLKDDINGQREMRELFDDTSRRIESSIKNIHPEIKVKSSIGRGNLSNVPWIVLYHPSQNRAPQDGVYCAYLFRSDMSGVYLCLTQGITPIDETESALEKRERIIEIVKILQKIPNQVEIENGKYILNIDLKDNGRLPRGYEDATAFAKYYDKNDIPNDKKIIQELDEMLKQYQEALTILKDNKIIIKPSTKILSVIIDETSKIVSKSPDFLSYLYSRGFSFDTDLIENFLLSLKVKPLIIITGNSGTGKTKLAQLFAQYLDLKEIIEDETIEAQVKVGKSAKNE